MKVRTLERSLLFAALLVAALTLGFGAMAWAAEGADGTGSANGASSADGADATTLAAGQQLGAQAQQSGTQAQELPSQFDLRRVDYDGDGKDVRCFVTPVRNQSPYGICWGFATTAAAETNILATKLADFPDAWKTLDFSEKQLAYFSHWHVDDPNSSQNGEGMYPVNFDPSKNNYDDLYTGGSVYLGAHAYAAGIGPTLESRNKVLEYRGRNGVIDEKGTCYAINDDWSLEDGYRTMHDYVLKESYILPSPYTTASDGTYQYNAEATRIIKENLYNLNAVTIGFTADTSRPWSTVEKIGDYMSAETWAHYTWKYEMPNHAVAIIGWDDNYPKENFKNKYSDLPESERPQGYSTPEGNGAWLVRNSWGAGTNEFPDKNTGQWGIPATDENGGPVYLKDSSGAIVVDDKGNPIQAGSGYFWLSYYDRSIMEPEVLMFDTQITEPGTYPYDQSTLHRNQYDLMPVSGTSHVADQLAKSANVFTPEKGEHVVAVSYETAAPDVTVTYEIYLLKDGFTSPVDGDLVARGTQTHTYKGFYMAYPEEAPFEVHPGQSYSVVLTQQCADKTYQVNVPSSMGENADLVKSGQIGSYARSVVNPGESFLYTNGEWQDWSLAITRTQLIPDVSPEAAAIMGNMDSQYDNFPIKAYAFDAPELEHVWGEATYLWAHDNSTCTAERACCVCGKTESETVDTTSAITKEPAIAVPGERTFEAAFSNAAFAAQTKQVAIEALPGGADGKSYKVAGNTYKVTSNDESTVTFTKAESAKAVTVPATVNIRGKSYKVTAIGPRAFAGAAKRLKSATIGKNVAAIGKSAFAGCTKLATVKGGAGGATVGELAFKGCKTMTKCAPVSSRKLSQAGARALSGASKLTSVTITSKKLKKAAVRSFLKGSSVEVVKVKVGSAKANKTYVKTYAKVFAAKNCGRRVIVK